MATAFTFPTAPVCDGQTLLIPQLCETKDWNPPMPTYGIQADTLPLPPSAEGFPPVLPTVTTPWWESNPSTIPYHGKTERIFIAKRKEPLGHHAHDIYSFFLLEHTNADVTSLHGQQHKAVWMKLYNFLMVAFHDNNLRLGDVKDSLRHIFGRPVSLKQKYVKSDNCPDIDGFWSDMQELRETMRNEVSTKPDAVIGRLANVHAERIAKKRQREEAQAVKKFKGQQKKEEEATAAALGTSKDSQLHDRVQTLRQSYQKATDEEQRASLKHQKAMLAKNKAKALLKQAESELYASEALVQLPSKNQ